MDVELLNQNFSKGLTTSDQLFWSIKLTGSSFRNSAAYLDTRFYPFYYHLGVLVTPKSVIQYGTDCGLSSVAFLQACKSVKKWSFIGTTTGTTLSNTRAFCDHVETTLPKAKQEYDMALLTLAMFTGPDTDAVFSNSLEMMWNELVSGGLLVVDYINFDSNIERFDEFCRVKNSKPMKFDTRYGVGILER